MPVAETVTSALLAVAPASALLVVAPASALLVVAPALRFPASGLMILRASFFRTLAVMDITASGTSCILSLSHEGNLRPLVFSSCNAPAYSAIARGRTISSTWISLLLAVLSQLRTVGSYLFGVNVEKSATNWASLGAPLAAKMPGRPWCVGNAGAEASANEARMLCHGSFCLHRAVVQLCV